MSFKRPFKDLDVETLSMKVRRYQVLFEEGELQLSDANLDAYLLLTTRIKEIQDEE